MITDLMRIRQAHNLTSRQVAEQAGLPLRTEYLAEIGGLVKEEDAGKIALAISALTGDRYTVEALGIIVAREDREQEVSHFDAVLC